MEAESQRPGMSIEQYARHRGVHVRAVSSALKSGRIARAAHGRIDPVQADIDWQRNTDPRRSAAGKRNGAIGQAMRRRGEVAPAASDAPDPPDPAPSAAAMPEVPGGPPQDIGEYAKARAVRERFAALLTKIEYEEKAGKLIGRDGVQTAAFAWNRILRDLIMSVPDRISAQLAAEADAANVHRMLEAELRSVLDKAATMRNLVPARAAKEDAYGTVG